jgi:hypothetical protein
MLGEYIHPCVYPAQYSVSICPSFCTQTVTRNLISHIAYLSQNLVSRLLKAIGDLLTLSQHLPQKSLIRFLLACDILAEIRTRI